MTLNANHTTPTERRIINRLIGAALRKGYTISVNDGEDWTIRQSNDAETITNALATTDRDTLSFRAEGKHIGSILLIWGNDEDVISNSDDTDHMNTIIAEAGQ